MDLNIPRFERIEEVAPLPADVAALVVDAAAGTGATKDSPATIGGPRSRLFMPVDGAFNGSMAAAMTRWKGQ